MRYTAIPVHITQITETLPGMVKPRMGFGIQAEKRLSMDMNALRAGSLLKVQCICRALTRQVCLARINRLKFSQALIVIDASATEINVSVHGFARQK